MRRIIERLEQGAIARHLAKWLLLVTPLSIVVGCLVALFLWLLDLATQTRWDHPWLVCLLPLAGIGIVWLYRKAGKNADAGNNLILEEIHQPGAGVPVRMAPLVLLTTIGTHLFGGSAGREGTAVQMGGGVAAYLARKLNLNAGDRRILLMCGMAAGFGAVFGTPVTGAIFALEVLTVGRIQYRALLPCMAASFIADLTCNAFPIHHTHFAITFSSSDASMIVPFIQTDITLLLIVIGAGVVFGLASFSFAELSHAIRYLSKRYLPRWWMPPTVGAVLVIGISLCLGTFDYIGLGVTSSDPDGVSIVNAFHEGGAHPMSWFWKLLLTAITLSLGFKGGEVTPLFFIGATLGNTIAVMTGAPIDLLAGLGFIAVFAGATNTPLACTLMGVELFGGEPMLYYAIACFTAYYFSGHSGIYSSQRVHIFKDHQDHGEGITLSDYRFKKPSNLNEVDDTTP